MRKKGIILLLACVTVSCVFAQDNIFHLVQAGGHVVIRQSHEIANVVAGHIARNRYKKIRGYRIRIFFDNGQTARQQSSATEIAFSESYPAVPVYREFEDLYYKVAVGDFRTKTDAMRFLESIRQSYPSAFIFAENVNFWNTWEADEPAAVDAAVAGPHEEDE
jgi:hypothetical protein